MSPWQSKKRSISKNYYLLGRYCGLRINECYGLKWENVDLEKGTISIVQQMGRQEGLTKLFPLKTRNARRTLYLNKILLHHLRKVKAMREEAEQRLSAQRQQNQTIIIDMNGEPLSCLELVNTLPDGKIQTVNSMKYHSKVLKDRYGINFKYHGWVFGLKNYVTIESPPEVVEGMQDMLSAVEKRYKGVQ